MQHHSSDAPGVHSSPMLLCCTRCDVIVSISCCRQARFTTMVSTKVLFKQGLQVWTLSFLYPNLNVLSSNFWVVCGFEAHTDFAWNSGQFNVWWSCFTCQLGDNISCSYLNRVGETSGFCWPFLFHCIPSPTYTWPTPKKRYLRIQELLTHTYENYPDSPPRVAHTHQYENYTCTLKNSAYKRPTAAAVINDGPINFSTQTWAS